ncbi:MAG: hypothetical protein ACC645_19330 [Pirellulales bacterium]
MCRFLMPSLVCCWLLIFVETSEAQLVRVGPGGVRVRAPFVRVEVGPYGRTYVRAPFTSVYSPGYRGVVRYHEYPVGPFAGHGAQPAGEANVVQMNWRELRQHVLVAASRFESELARLEGGADWRTTLRPGTIRDLLAKDSDQPPDQATTEQLLAILKSYDRVAGSDDLQPITRLSGFRAVRQALGELTLPPRQRQRRNLAKQWMALRRDLGRFQSGASWQGHLELPPEVMAGSENSDALDIARNNVEEPDVQQLEKVLSRYQQVDSTDEYRAIARLASFQATRQLLASYMDLLIQTDSGLDLPPPPPEELRLPQPREFMGSGLDL